MIGMDATTGRRIEGAAHLRQSIADILGTLIGTRIERREYGSLVPELVDAPSTGGTFVRLYAAAATALMRWEPRVRISRIFVTHIGADGRVVLEITGSLVDGSAVALSVPVGRSA